MGWQGPTTDRQYQVWLEWFAWQAELTDSSAPQQTPAKNQLSSQQVWCAAAKVKPK